MTTAAKQRIIDAIEELPVDSLEALGEFVEFLRAKALARAGAPAAGQVVKLGGLWKGYSFSEDEIRAARADAWTGLGREPG